MRIAVVYASKTGHSKKIAKAVADKLGVPCVDIREKPAIENAGLLFIAGGLYGGQSLPEMLVFADGLEPGAIKQAVLLTSCATKAARQETLRRHLEDRGIPVAGEEFLCRGAFLLFCFGHPDRADLADAAAFAARIVEERTQEEASHVE